MDANSKVQRYLDDLRRDANAPAADTLRSVRGPGQISKDPLQFVATKSGEDMAEKAKMLVIATEQQKMARKKEQKGVEVAPTRQAVEEDWQADLDTWRRKRKTKVESPLDTVLPTTPPTYGSSVDYGIRKDSTKEEILTIRSPYESNDSGIENRTLSHSPSTSIDFSPRSAELTSPKSLEAVSPPEYAPPPPPLDQVLIPISAPSSAAQRTLIVDEPEDYPLPPTHLREKSSESSSELLSPSRARVSASFPATRQQQRLEPFVSQSLREPSSSKAEKSVNAELTVELNREQKAHVQAIKFPTTTKSERPGARGAEAAALRSAYTPRSLEERHNNGLSFVTTARHTFESPTQPTSRSASTPNVSQQTTKPVYRAVDIPFDDSAATYQPPKRDKDGLMTIVVEMGGQPVHKGFGFSVATERRRCFVDSVIVGTPADRQGLLIGDRIDSINGESVGDKYPSAVNRLLHEAARNGEVVLRVERTHTKSSFGSTPNLAAPMGTRFDQARSVFSEKQNDSYAEFKRKHSRAAREKPSPREYNSLPRSSSTGYIGRSEYGTSDYRVSSIHDKSKPGKLDDFVPEVDRRRENGFNIVGPRNSYEETRTIRNYELIGSAPTAVSREDVSSVSSPLRQKTSSDEDNHLQQDNDTVPGKAYLRKELRNFVVSHEAKTKEIEEDLEEYLEPSRTIYASPEDLEDSEEEDSMSRGDFHVVGAYGTGRKLEKPREYGRRRDADGDSLGSREVSDVSHRFYDREGHYVERIRSEERIIPIRREYTTARDADYRTESRDWRDVINQQRQPAPGKSADTRRIQQATSSLSNLPDIMDKKLEEQRRLLSDRRDFDYQSKSVDRREPREIYERSEYSFYEKTYTPSFDVSRNTSSTTAIQETERRYPLSSSSDYMPREASRDHLVSREAPQERVREPSLPREAPRQKEILREAPREVVSPQPEPLARTVTEPLRQREERKEAIHREPENRDPVVAVSGKHRCAHCGEELGRGAAMIVESLNLFYHLACFKCYVCKTPLGSGTTGADVRVREGRLHCQSCYSSDRVQLSKV